MKVRMGFVSNSSSSSFLLYGTFIDEGKVETPEILQLIIDAGEAKTLEEAKQALEDDAYDIVDLVAGELGLSCWSPCECDGYYVGKSWAKVGDDETGKQFKDNIEKQIAKVFPEAKCCTLEEAWYNG